MKKTRGSLLAELLVSIFILAVPIFGTVGVLAFTTRSARFGGGQVKAVELGREVMDRAIDGARQTFDAQPATVHGASFNVPSFAEYVYDVDASAVNGNLKNITVSVRWVENGTSPPLTRSIRLDTAVSR